MNELAEITCCYTMRFDRRTEHSPARVWRAITNAEEVARWMAYPTRIDLRVGGEYHLDFSRTDGGELDGMIVRLAPERRLAYVWGVSVLEWTLEVDGDGCRYQFVHHGMPPLENEDVAAGWHAWLEDLTSHLEGRAPDAAAGHALVSALLPSYRERIETALGRG